MSKHFFEEGFSFIKSEFCFKKKQANSIIGCFFTFYNFPPFKVEYNFTFYFLLNELEADLKKFYSFCGIEYRKGKGIYVSEGDFHPAVCNQEAKYRTAFTHVISDLENDYYILEDTKRVLINEFFPRIEIFSDLHKFARLIIDDYHLCFKYGGPLYSALAIKLEDKEEFFLFLGFLRSELKVDSLNPNHVTRKMIENLYSYGDYEFLKKSLSGNNKN